MKEKRYSADGAKIVKYGQRAGWDNLFSLYLEEIGSEAIKPDNYLSTINLSKKILIALKKAGMDFNYIDDYGYNFLLFSMELIDSRQTIKDRRVTFGDDWRETISYIIKQTKDIEQTTKTKKNVFHYLAGIGEGEFGRKNQFILNMVGERIGESQKRKLLNSADHLDNLPMGMAIAYHNETLMKLYAKHGAKINDGRLIYNFLFDDIGGDKKSFFYKVFKRALLYGDITKSHKTTSSAKDGDGNLMLLWSKFINDDGNNNEKYASNIATVLTLLLKGQAHYGDIQKLKEIIDKTEKQLIKNKYFVVKKTGGWVSGDGGKELRALLDEIKAFIEAKIIEGAVLQMDKKIKPNKL